MAQLQVERLDSSRFRSFAKRKGSSALEQRLEVKPFHLDLVFPILSFPD